ncbi:hypothetical protein Tco_0583409, partial [Tanacetum coccineum]
MMTTLAWVGLLQTQEPDLPASRLCTIGTPDTPKSSLLGLLSCASFVRASLAIEKLGKWWDCQLGIYIWGGGDSGGGGSVLSRVLKGCRVKEGEDTQLAPKVILHP